MNIAQPFRHASIAAATLFGAGAALAAAPGPAVAAQQLANGPIEIRSCAVVYAPQPAEQTYSMGYSDVAGIEVDYVNHADVAAEDVTFRVGSESSGTLVADHGSFAPGVLIQRVFWTGPSADASSCSVTSARLTGGTAFDAAAAPGSSKR